MPVIKIPRNLQIAGAFVIVLAVIAVLVWGYTSLNSSSAGESQSGSRGLFGSLFPFMSPSIPGGTGTSVQDEEGAVGAAPLVRHVTDKKVAGATFAPGIQGGLAIRYVERETGHIYETPTDSLSVTRLTNTTIPAVHDALWTSASTTIMRFLAEDGHIENFAGSFATSAPDQVLGGSFLKNYTRIAVSGTNLLLGVLEGETGATIQVVEKGKTTSLFTSPIRSWIPFIGGKKMFVAPAPAAGLLGSLFEVSATGLLTQVGPSLPGMDPSVSPDGTAMIASVSSGTSIVLLYYNIATGASLVLPHITLREKCAWVPKQTLLLCAVPVNLPIAQYPNDWLLGRVHTTDDLWYMDPLTGAATSAADLHQTSEFGADQIDATDLTVSPDGRYVLFRNKLDSSLWAATLPLQNPEAQTATTTAR